MVACTASYIVCSIIFALTSTIGSGPFLFFLPSGMRFIGEDKNVLALQGRAPFVPLLLCSNPISLPSSRLLRLAYSLSLPPSLLQSGLREIFHSSFDKCQIDSMSSFKLNCLGKLNLLRRTIIWMTSARTHQMAQQEKLLSGSQLTFQVALSISPPYSYLFTADPNGNFEI